MQLVGSGLVDTYRNYVVEDVGVQPDIHVPLTISGVRSGIDRDLVTAGRILTKKQRKEESVSDAQKKSGHTP